MKDIINRFVGRNSECRQWLSMLAEPGDLGQAVVVTGNDGMGKTWLLDRMLAEAEHRDSLHCVSLRYTVTPEESPGMMMKMILEDAFQAARYEAGGLAAEGKRFFQWNRLYRKLGLFSGAPDYSFFHSLRYDSRKNILHQFAGRLRVFVDMLPDNGRLLLVVDPRQDTPALQIRQWADIVRSLPPKVFFLFAQRHKDPLVADEEFRTLRNVVFLPEDGLSGLTDDETLRLIETYRTFPEDRLPEDHRLLEVFRRYGNHPYAVHAALNLFLGGFGSPDRLPEAPMPGSFAVPQWKLVCEHPMAKEATRLLESYAILEVPVVDEMVCWVADLSRETLDRLLADPFLRSLLRDEPDGRVIYHHHLASYIRADLYAPGGNLTLEAEQLHQRAMIGYGDLMRRAVKPDALATLRFAEHSLAVGGPELFAEALVKSADAFLALGFFQSFAAKIERALDLVASGSVEQADLLFQFGRLRLRQGDSDAAREHFEKSLRIARNLAEPERIADALFALGKIAFQSAHDDEEAELKLREAIAFYENGLNRIGLVEALVLLGNILWRLRRIEEGNESLSRAVEAAKKIRNYRQQARAMAGVFTTWGNIFDEIGDFDHAADLFLKALDLTRDIYDREAEAELRATLGSMFERNGVLQMAEENLVKAMEIHEDLKLIEHWADDCFRLARLAKKQGRREMSCERFRLARQLYFQLGNLVKLKEIDEIAEEFY